MENNKFIITEDKFIPPLLKILEDTTPGNIPAKSSPQKPAESLKESLDNIFPEQQREEKEIRQTKEILGVLADEFTQKQLRDVLAEVQYLAESWLDCFEREIFRGKTLQELLHEKGGV